MVRSHYDPPDLNQSTEKISAFFSSQAPATRLIKRINFLAQQAQNLLPSYSAQPSCVKVRCRSFLMSARTAQMGPALVKNWAAKNYAGVLFKSPW